MSLVIGFELCQGDETLHHPNKLYIHLRDRSIQNKDSSSCLYLSCLQKTTKVRVVPKVSKTFKGQQMHCVPWHDNTWPSPSLLCPVFPSHEINRNSQSLPWTIWGCPLCWMGHNRDCFSQTVCGLGKPPSQSETKPKGPVIYLYNPLHGQLESTSTLHLPPCTWLLSPWLLRWLNIIHSLRQVKFQNQPWFYKSIEVYPKTKWYMSSIGTTGFSHLWILTVLCRYLLAWRNYPIEPIFKMRDQSLDLQRNLVLMGSERKDGLFQSLSSRKGP